MVTNEPVTEIGLKTTFYSSEDDFHLDSRNFRLGDRQNGYGMGKRRLKIKFLTNLFRILRKDRDICRFLRRLTLT